MERSVHTRYPCLIALLLASILSSIDSDSSRAAEASDIRNGGNRAPVTRNPQPATRSRFTFDASSAAAAAPVAPEQQAALDRMNGYRRLAGLAPLRLDAAMNRAAVNHATYYVLNAGDPGLRGMGLHDEQTGKPGYTGATMADRIHGAGYPGSWNEGMALLGNPTAAVDSFMTTVHHRLPILSASNTDTGYGGHTGKRPVDVFTYGGKAPRPTPPEFVAYPANGMTGAPTRYTGDETNAAFPGAHYPVGTAITLQYTGPGDVALVAAQVSGPDGTPLPLLTRVSYDFITRNVIIVAPQQPLQPDVRYTVRIDGTRPAGAFTQSWSFVTA
ncbi:MAG TPA: CAP domain-containing protein, partial [Chloroflexia bacterium]|nr:CAP domain-containing protein [Chloroflexia bacterium]